MRRLNEVELAVVCGGEVEGGPDFPVFPSGMRDAEWAQWEIFFADQETRNAPKP